MSRRGREGLETRQGFTLVELLLVLAVLGILAAVGWVAWRRYARKAKTSEVYAMIAAIKQAEESYKAETGSYLSTGATENDFYPVLGSKGTEPTLKPFDVNNAPDSRWKDLNVSAPSKNLYCGYVVIAGPAGAWGSAGARGQTLFGGKLPTTPWYYIRATCDLDGKSGTNSFYETTFDRETVYVENEGN